MAKRQEIVSPHPPSRLKQFGPDRAKLLNLSRELFNVHSEKGPRQSTSSKNSVATPRSKLAPNKKIPDKTKLQRISRELFNVDAEKPPTRTANKNKPRGGANKRKSVTSEEETTSKTINQDANEVRLKKRSKTKVPRLSKLLATQNPENSCAVLAQRTPPTSPSNKMKSGKRPSTDSRNSSTRASISNSSRSSNPTNTKNSAQPRLSSIKEANNDSNVVKPSSKKAKSDSTKTNKRRLSTKSSMATKKSSRLMSSLQNETNELSGGGKSKQPCPCVSKITSIVEN